MKQVAAWVVAAQRGDGSAFGALVRRFQDYAYGVAMSRLRDVQLAEDAAQDALIDAFERLGQLREPAAFGAWLKRIVLTRCRQLTVRGAAEQRVVQNWHGVDASGRGRTPLFELVGGEDEATLLRVVWSLPVGQRVVIILHCLGEYPVRELSRMLELSAPAVKKRLHDGRVRMKAMLDQCASRSVDVGGPASADELVKAAERALKSMAPSRNGAFATRVAFCNACIAGDVRTVRRLLERDESLVSCHGEVSEAHMRKLAVHDGWPALHLAAHYGHLAVVKELVERGAAIEGVSRNAIGNTALAAAAWGDRLDVVEYLLDRGADVDAANAHGDTALHRAATAGRAEVVKLLLRSGASRNCQNAEGKRPWDLATESGHENIARVLRAQDA